MKILKTILMVSVFIFMYSFAFAQPATSETVDGKTKVWADGVKEKWTTNSVDTVLGSAEETFKIPARNVNGRIVEVYFTSTSPNCDIWISEADNQTAASAQTIIAITDINLGTSLLLESPVYYANTLEEAYLFLTISEQDGTATGNWDYVLTYDRY